MPAKLNVNIDHVATIREARKTIEPDVTAAAIACEQAGADGITVHLRSDRRHIQDKDIAILRQVVKTYLNVEMAATEEMLAIAVEIKPDAVSIVPESPDEITTEGGLDVVKHNSLIRAMTKKLREAGVFVSVFIDPDPKQIKAAQKIGAQQIEICTAEYAELTISARSSHGEGARKVAKEIRRIHDAAVLGRQLGLHVAAGHGLTTRNIPAMARISEITEFNIGHHIISRSVFCGLEAAVREMIDAIHINSEI